MVIGGFANAVWGTPRATIDIDVTIWAPDRSVTSVLQALAPPFTALTSDPVTFVSRTRVLPIRSESGVRADVIFGFLPFEEEAIGRAPRIPFGDVEVRVATPEDLILHKIISDREEDQADVRGIIRARLAQMDLSYLEPRIRELADLLERPDIWHRWERWKVGTGT